MKMTMIPENHDGTPNTDRSNVEGNCDVCGARISRFRGQGGDLRCHGTDPRTGRSCPAIYNLFGQRLRDDLYTRRNPSADNEDIGDLEGDELSWLALESQSEDY